LTGEVSLFLNDIPRLIPGIEGDYFDLSLVPERYTGYSGPAAHRLWKSIYEENCFGLSELHLKGNESAIPVTLPDTMTGIFKEDGSLPEDDDDTCLEKRVYYKIISGAWKGQNHQNQPLNAQ
jgi:ERO1-like protein beta